MEYPPTIHQKEQQTLQHEKRLRTTFIPTCYWKGISDGLFVNMRDKQAETAANQRKDT